MAGSYDGSNIKVLEGLEAVRKRPGMYIGTTSVKGLHHLVWEIVDNSIDEALAGFCDSIHIKICEGNVIQVIDNGRGVPVDIHPHTGLSTVETIFTVLHAGGKFDNSTYKVSGGLHGVGASVVNALSDDLEVIVQKNGGIYRQAFKKGDPVSGLEEIGTTNVTGTSITFKPDPTIFTDTVVFDFETLRVRAQQLAFLNKGLSITIEDLRDVENVESEVYCYEGGIKEYVEYLNATKDPIQSVIFHVEDEIEDVVAEVSFQYNKEYIPHIYSFVNNIHTSEGGTHEDGFKSAVSRELLSYAKKNNLLKKDETFSSDDSREGLVAVVSIKHHDPQFEGQTKGKLSNSEVRKVVSQISGKAISTFLLENPTVAKVLVEKAMLASKARQAAKRAKEATRRKSPLDSLGFASKLADCRSKNAEESEVYIVEGDSAGGSAKQGRDSAYQAILPLRGKVINVEKSKMDKILQNKEIKSLIQALGVGFGDEFNIEKLRYKKIIIMTDADVDGAHIRVLLLTFIFRFLPELIMNGYVYLAQPPLFKVSYKKRVEYAYVEEDLEPILESFSAKPNIQRYKGLGEMNPDQLWETTMDPKTRTLLQVDMNDAIDADVTFSMLMGEAVEPRRDFIQKHALEVKNIDI